MPAGLDVAEAENGQAAVSAFDRMRPDLVLLDVVMPLMDGFEACRQSVAWQAEGCPPIRVAVNASAVQFSDTDFAQTVQQTLDKTGMDPRFLEIEITETVVLKDLEKAYSNLQRLKDIGVTTTLDDFGTGYASITYLRQMPLDGLKIDKSFIRDLETVSPPKGLPEHEFRSGLCHPGPQFKPSSGGRRH